MLDPNRVYGIKAKHQVVCHQEHSVPKEVDIRRCASEDTRLRLGVDYEISHRLERETSVNENVRPRNGWIMRSHINWREERVLTRTLGPEGS